MPPHPLRIKGATVLFSEMTPPDGGEDAFNEWYDGHHTPDHVRGVPGFRSAMRYKSPVGPHYLAVYELTSPDALECEEYKSRKLTPDDATRNMLDAVSGFTRYIANEAYCRVRGANPAAALDAPVLYCAFYAVPMERRGAFERWHEEDYVPMLFDCPDWQMVRRFDVIESDPEPYTHLALHYLADARALDSDALARARGTRGYQALAAEPWFAPHFVTYYRRNARFFKTG